VADVGSFIDRYTLTARFAPAVLVTLPLGLAFATWFPPEKHLPAALTAVGGTIALAVLLGQLGRDQGKKKQPELFRDWGGPPTSRMLSHRHSSFNPLTLGRYHERLKTLIPGLQLPASKDEEQADPAKANLAYESAGDYLREATRDRDKFRMVMAENINYGFRRNLWAMKSAGIVACLIALVIVGIRAGETYFHRGEVEALTTASLLFSCVLLVLWLVRVTRSWVRIAADEYSRQLLSACDKLPPNEV
jgi:hypothetical protein